MMLDVDVTEPEIRGPYFWDMINIMGIAYYPLMKDKYKKFFDVLSDVLPCGECRTNYKKFMISNPIDLSSQPALLEWIYKLHNDINKRNDKDIRDEEQFLDYIHTRYASKKEADGEPA